MWVFGRLVRRRVRRKRVRSRSERTRFEAYKEKARALAHDRVAHWSVHLSVTPGRIAIRDQRSRWGSCSTKGNLNFNYRIVFLPTELVDYIVVHELCHLIEFNHSERFWNHVGRVLTDYLLRREALHLLSKQGFTWTESRQKTILSPLSSTGTKVSVQ
jgi:predicted metal-dependent hydrolase